MELGVHLVDLALWTLAPARVVDVSADLFAEGRPLIDSEGRTEDFALATLRLDTGAVVRLAGCCCWPPNHSAVGSALPPPSPLRCARSPPPPPGLPPIGDGPRILAHISQYGSDASWWWPQCAQLQAPVAPPPAVAAASTRRPPLAVVRPDDAADAGRGRCWWW